MCLVLLPSGVTHICVLVFVDPVEVKRLVVDQKLCAGDFNGTNSHRKSVNVRLSVLCCRLNLQNQIRQLFMGPSHFNSILQSTAIFSYIYSILNWNILMHEKCHAETSVNILD